MEFPRTMTAGRFKGRRFKSWTEYQNALRDSHKKNGVRTYKPRAKKPTEPEIHVHLIITSAGDIKVVKA
jgi:hypothetical protein